MTFNIFIKKYLWTYFGIYIHIHIVNNYAFSKIGISMALSLFLFQMIYYVKVYTKEHGKIVVLLNIVNLLVPIIFYGIILFNIGV